MKEAQNKMAVDILPEGTTHYVVVNNLHSRDGDREIPVRSVTVDKKTNRTITITQEDYEDNLARGYFRFMINPDFGKGIMEERV